MRIACISNSIIPSPAANGLQVMKMCEALTRLGHDVTLFARKIPGAAPAPPLDYYAISDGFAFERTSMHSKPLHSMAAVLRAWRGGFGLCFTRSAAAAALASALGMRVVFEIHRPFASWLGRRTAGLILGSPRVLTVAISRALRAHCALHYGPLGESRIMTAHDGVDLHLFSGLPSRAALREELGLPGGDRIVCYAGGLYPGRGVERLVALTPVLPTGTRVLIVGGRPADIERVGAEGTEGVTFTGHLPHDMVPRYLAASDVLVIPYEARPRDVAGTDIGAFMSPLKVFEYMASGTPIVASDLPVLREVLRDEESALMFEPGSTEGMRRAIERVLEDGDAAAAMAMRAREKARGYTWERRAEAIITRAAEVLGAP